MEPFWEKMGLSTEPQMWRASELLDCLRQHRQDGILIYFFFITFYYFFIHFWYYCVFIIFFYFLLKFYKSYILFCFSRIGICNFIC